MENKKIMNQTEFFSDTIVK